MVLSSAFNITDHSPSLFSYGRCIVGFSHSKDKVVPGQTNGYSAILRTLQHPTAETLSSCDNEV